MRCAHQEERSDGRNAVGDVGDVASDNASTRVRHAVVVDIDDTPKQA
jgi:hypothetical protein